MQNKLLDVKDVASILGCKPNYVYQLVANKKIKTVKIGGLLRFKEEFVDELIDSSVS